MRIRIYVLLGKYTANWATGTLQDAESSDLQLKVQCECQITAGSQPGVQILMATTKLVPGTEMEGAANS